MGICPNMPLFLRGWGVLHGRLLMLLSQRKHTHPLGFELKGRPSGRSVRRLWRVKRMRFGPAHDHVHFLRKHCLAHAPCAELQASVLLFHGFIVDLVEHRLRVNP